MCIYIYRAEKGDEEDDGDVEGCGPFDWSGVVKRRKRIEREDVCAEVEGERGEEQPILFSQGSLYCRQLQLYALLP